MTEPMQGRRWGRIALISCVAIVALGSASGWLSNSGYGNGWFDALRKPSFMPPGWAFGVVWPVHYVMLGLSLAMVIAVPPSTRRTAALALFFVQLALNFAWSPIFFAAHDIDLAKIVIVLMVLLTVAAAALFWRIRQAAALLLIPYVAWLVFAAALNWAIADLNPGAGVTLLG
ncbi:MAG: TspO/MBR family protein [Sphingomicrobium sp.]